MGRLPFNASVERPGLALVRQVFDLLPVLVLDFAIRFYRPALEHVAARLELVFEKLLALAVLEGLPFHLSAGAVRAELDLVRLFPPDGVHDYRTALFGQIFDLLIVVVGDHAFFAVFLGCRPAPEFEAVSPELVLAQSIRMIVREGLGLHLAFHAFYALFETAD